MMHNMHDDVSLLTSLFQNCRVNAIIHMNQSGIIHSVNTAFTSYFGWTNADLSGTNFSILFTAKDRAENKPQNEINEVIAQGHADDKNYMVHKDGLVSWVSGESVLIQQQTSEGSILKILQDITSAKQTEESLSRADAFNESILNAIDDVVIVLDKSLRILQFNPAFARLFRSEAVPVIENLQAFLQPYDDNGQLLDKIWQVAKHGGSFNHHLLEIHGEQRKRFFDISCQVLQLEDNAEGIMLVGRDITTQKQVDADREDLLGFVVHELRTPLASLQITNELMRDFLHESTKEQLQTYLERAGKNIDRLKMMTTELYDSTRIAGGGITLKKAAFQFDGMVREVIETFQLLHPENPLVIEGHAAITYYGDQYRLGQVLGNYLANAIKYSDKDRPITITTTVSAESITVSVADKGPGIPPAHLPYVFNRFFRAEKTRNLEGIGLGLFLCKQVIQAHGGSVRAESIENSGSTFYFSLPIVTN